MATQDEQLKALREKVSRNLRKLAAHVEAAIIKLGLQSNIAGEPTTFCLLLNTHGNTQYISNANREDVKLLMKELLARWDEDEGHTPYHLQTGPRKDYTGS